mmetsp:Transcript_26984/g.44940  ORF Transcript_26984/g.44940 Transcript_26984/m.44940 type:complete len:550 (+) Transcript_26984:47-1696(+)
MTMATRASRFPSQAVVDLFLSCRNLPSTQVEHMHPFCVLHRVESGKSGVPPKQPSLHEVNIGQTEVVMDCACPNFEISFRIEYHFEEEQNFSVRCFSGEGGLQEEYDYLGGFYFSMGQLVGATGNSLAIPLGLSPRSFVLIRAEPTKDSSEVLRFQLCAKKLKREGFFGGKKSNPFYVIQGLGSDRTSWNTIWQSPVMQNNQNPIWDIDEIGIQKLSNGDYNRMVRIQVMNWRGDGKHDDMGGVVMSVNELLRVPNTFEVLRATRNGENKPAGSLSVISADILNRPTMVDYITGGCEINLMVAVDFTLSNGSPDDSKSLHYRGGKNPNEYQQAMSSIGGIVQNYATNKWFPIWGFGAKINHVKQDCLSLGGGRPVQGAQGLLNAYKNAFTIPEFALSGPTNFMPVLRAAAETAAANQRRGKQCYSILVILTDGVITDVEQTVDMICRISETAPLSIVIIGVGKADFRKMEMLDDDSGFLRDSQGQPAERDIVQFVPYRKYATNVDKLTAEVLYEIPKQLVGYFQSRNVKPNAPIPMPTFHEKDIFVDKT